LGAVIGAKETYNDENAPEQSQRAPNTAGVKTLSQKSQSGPIRTQRRLGRDPPRTPLGEISKQFKTLAGNVEKAFQEQTQVQEQTRQGDVKNLWTWVTDALNNMKAEQQIREENYIGRINALEQEIRKLQTIQATQKPTPALTPAQPTPAPIPITAPTAHGPPCGAAKNTREDLPIRPTKALSAQRQPEKKAAPSYAAALMDIRSGGQEWQVVPPKQKKVSKIGPTAALVQTPENLKPAKEKNKEARRIIFRRDMGNKAPKANREDIILALNRALAGKGLPSFIRVVDAGYTETGAISVLLGQGSLGSMVIPSHRDLVVAAACKADQTVVSVELPEQWYRVKVHGIPKKRYLTLGLGLAREEIEISTEYRLKRDPTWLRNPGTFQGEEKKGSSIVVTVGSFEEARRMVIDGLRFGGSRFRAEHYWEIGADAVCPRCCGIGHTSFRACGDRPPCCYICAGAHEGAEHACKVINCQAKIGTSCPHLPAKCSNCGRNHPANTKACPKLREARLRRSNKPQHKERIPSPNTRDLIPSSPGFAAIIPNQATLDQPIRQTNTQTEDQNMDEWDLNSESEEIPPGPPLEASRHAHAAVETPKVSEQDLLPPLPPLPTTPTMTIRGEEGMETEPDLSSQW
jgi:hypothetical protein